MRGFVNVGDENFESWCSQVGTSQPAQAQENSRHPLRGVQGFSDPANNCRPQSHTSKNGFCRWRCREVSPGLASATQDRYYGLQGLPMANVLGWLSVLRQQAYEEQCVGMVIKLGNAPWGTLLGERSLANCRGWAADGVAPIFLTLTLWCLRPAGGRQLVRTQRWPTSDHQLQASRNPSGRFPSDWAVGFRGIGGFTSHRLPKSTDCQNPPTAKILGNKAPVLSAERGPRAPVGFVFRRALRSERAGLSEIDSFKRSHLRESPLARRFLWKGSLRLGAGNVCCSGVGFDRGVIGDVDPNVDVWAAAEVPDE